MKSITGSFTKSATRSVTSDLVPPGFRVRSEALPKSKPPRWMTWAWMTAACGTVICLALTLTGPMDEFVLTQGVVRPADYALVFPSVAGTAEEVPPHSGDQVKAGQILCRLDTSDLRHQRATLEAEVAQAQAALAITEADLAATKAAPIAHDLMFLAKNVDQQRQVVAMRRELLTRMEQAGTDGSLPLVELTRERLAVKAAETDLGRAIQAAAFLDGGYASAAIAASEGRTQAAAAHLQGLVANVRNLDDELERRIVRAPTDGQIVSRAVRFPGEQVVLGTALFKIAKGNSTQLRLYATEDRVNRIKPGMKVRFRPRSDPDRLARMAAGRVIDVALDRDLSKEDNDHPERRGTYAIDVTVEAGAPALPLGAAVDAEIVLEERPFWRLLLMKKTAPTPSK